MELWQRGHHGEKDMLCVWGNLLSGLQQWIAQQNQGYSSQDTSV